MSRELSVSSKEASEKVSSENLGRIQVDFSEIDVAAQIAIGVYGETITDEQARKLKCVNENIDHGKNLTIL